MHARGGFSRLGVWSFLLLFLASFAFADSIPPDIIFHDTGKLKPVLFSHAQHQKNGVKCAECHDGLFQKKKGSTDTDNALTMKAIWKKQYCGACHNGGRAFATRGKCKTCHVDVK